jgi:hypothetical protein
MDADRCRSVPIIADERRANYFDRVQNGEVFRAILGCPVAVGEIRSVNPTGVLGLMSRLSYAESCKLLEPYGACGSEPPPMPSGIPKHDADILGVNFFRTVIEDAKFENLTLPRTFFGRSEIKNSSFAGSDLSKSHLCWNEFVGVSFCGTLLAGADLRASDYQKCDFIECDLSGADLRRASFKNCVFKGAILKDAIIPRRLKKVCEFSEDQIAQAKLIFFEGPEPDGG